MPTAIKTDVPKFRDIKNRVSDLYEHSGDSIREKKTVMATASIFAEMQWMIDEINRLGMGDAKQEDADRFAKIAKFVARVNEEHFKAIKTGQFMRISGEIFGAMRFLVRVLQRALVRVVDDAVADSLLADLMPNEYVGRIQLDLTEGVADPVDPAQFKPEAKIMTEVLNSQTEAELTEEIVQRVKKEQEAEKVPIKPEFVDDAPPG